MMIIDVNGKRFEWEFNEIRYSELVILAGGNPNVLYSITAKAPGLEGKCLTRGESIRVTDGMIFSVYYTGNA